MPKKLSNEIKERLPTKVKSHEEGKINLGYINITDKSREGKPFIPVPGVPYLWVYTENKELIVGVEEPWKYPQAFIDVKDTKQMEEFKKLAETLKSSGKLGHPTLAATFDEKSKEALPHGGKAYIGGELTFVNNKWFIDNNSGRFGDLEHKPQLVQYLMHDVKNKFIEAMKDVSPNFKITLSHSSYLKSYNAIWQSGKNDVDSALKLLRDYAKFSTFDLILSGRWGTNNAIVVREILSDLELNPPSKVSEVLQKILEKIDLTKIEPDGSLARVLHFIAGQTNNSLEKKSEDPSNTRRSI